MIPAKEQFHLYLLMGQSNMAGRGPLPAAPVTPDPRILALNRNSEWIVVTEPLHWDKSTAGVGPGLSFARLMLAGEPHDAVRIGLVPCAVGGTPLRRWQNGGDLFENAFARARVAMGAGTLKGILWQQGENDSLSETESSTYADRLSRMIAEFHATLGAEEIPFVVGKLGLFLEDEPRDPFSATINRALMEIPSRVPWTACVDSAGLGHKGDSVHFDSDAGFELGKRYAQAMMALLRASALRG